jgi:uncharacterized protein DUF6285
MTDISNAADLVETAREALLVEVLPALPPERRYVARMAANAMAIAAREHRHGPAAMRGEADRLAALLALIGRPRGAPRAADADHLHVLRRDVAAAIRAGRFDDAERARTLSAALAQTAHDWLAISNPKALRETSPVEVRARSAGEDV